MLSVQRTEVAGLHLAEVDLRACRFAGAHNLDRLRAEGAPLFTRTPGWWRARRKTLAEEQHWRATRPDRWRAAGWYPRVCQPPASPKAEAPGVVEPARLAALYRARAGVSPRNLTGRVVHRRPTVAEPNRSATAGRRPSRRRGVEGAGCHSACHSTRYHAAQQDRTSWTAQLT